MHSETVKNCQFLPVKFCYMSILSKVVQNDDKFNNKKKKDHNTYLDLSEQLQDW